MVKKTDANLDEQENQESLLNALESIKGLLEKSESKLSAARSSLKGAKTSQDSHKMSNKIPVSNEPVFPVLDDVVFDDNDEQAIDSDQKINLDAIPTLSSEDDLLIEDDSEALEPSNTIEAEESAAPAMPATGDSLNAEEMLAYLDSFQAALEKDIRDTLMRTVVSIESEVKKTVAAQIEQLRNEIKNSK